MITEKDILTGINSLLVAAYPQSTVYLNLCPDSFVRPSFLLEHAKTTCQDINKNTVALTVNCNISCFLELNEDYAAAAEALMARQEGVISLFSSGYMEINTRSLKVKANAGSLDPGVAYVELQLEYYDDRWAEVDDKPLMATVNTNLQEG